MKYIHRYHFTHVDELSESFEQIHAAPKREKVTDVGIGGATLVNARHQWFERAFTRHEKAEELLNWLGVKRSDFVCEGGNRGRGRLCKRLRDDYAVSLLWMYEFTIPMIMHPDSQPHQRRIWVNVQSKDDIGTAHPICRSLVLLEPWDAGLPRGDSIRYRGSSFSAVVAMIQRELERFESTIFAESDLWEGFKNAAGSHQSVWDRQASLWQLMNPMQILTKMGARLISRSPKAVETLFIVRDDGAGQVFGYPVFLRSSPISNKARSCEEPDFVVEVASFGEMHSYRESYMYPDELVARLPDDFVD